MRKRITLKEIAAMASVSVSTVSLALNDSPKTSLETKQKIRELSEKLNYRPCPMAKGLVKAKTWTIGVISSGFCDPFPAELAEELQKQLAAKKYLAIHLVASQVADIPKTIEMLLDRRVDGLILETSTIPAEGLALLNADRIPFVLSEEPWDPIPDVDFVTVSKFRGGFLAVEHLIKLGYRKIGFLCADDPKENRVLGYREAMSRHRLPVREEWIIPGTGYLHLGYEGMRKILALPERPEAIFAHTDLAALGAWRAVREAGLSVPGDFAFVGFDNIREGEYASPPLTTVDQPREEIARKLVEVLLDKVEGRDENTGPRQIILEPQLVIRESCGFNARPKKSV